MMMHTTPCIQTAAKVAAVGYPAESGTSAQREWPGRHAQNPPWPRPWTCSLVYEGKISLTCPGGGGRRGSLECTAGRKAVHRGQQRSAGRGHAAALGLPACQAHQGDDRDEEEALDRGPARDTKPTCQATEGSGPCGFAARPGQHPPVVRLPRGLLLQRVELAVGHRHEEGHAWGGGGRACMAGPTSHGTAPILGHKAKHPHGGGGAKTVGTPTPWSGTHPWPARR